MSLISYYAPVVESTMDGRGRVVAPMPVERAPVETRPLSVRPGVWSTSAGANRINVASFRNPAIAQRMASVRTEYREALAEYHRQGGILGGGQLPTYNVLTGKVTTVGFGGVAARRTAAAARATEGGMTQPAGPGESVAAMESESGGGASLQSWALLAAVGVVAWFLLAS